MLLCGTVPDTTKNKTYASILTFQDGSDGTSLDGNVELSRDMQPFCSFWWNEEEIFETKTNKDKGTWGFYLFIRPYFAKVERNSSNNVPQLLGYLESHVYWLFPASRRRGGGGWKVWRMSGLQAFKTGFSCGSQAWCTFSGVSVTSLPTTIFRISRQLFNAAGSTRKSSAAFLIGASSTIAVASSLFELVLKWRWAIKDHWSIFSVGWSNKFKLEGDGNAISINK